MQGLITEGPLMIAAAIRHAVMCPARQARFGMSGAVACTGTARSTHTTAGRSRRRRSAEARGQGGWTTSSLPSAWCPR